MLPCAALANLTSITAEKYIGTLAQSEFLADLNLVQSNPLTDMALPTLAALHETFRLDIQPHSPVLLFVDRPSSDTAVMFDQAMRQVQNFRPVVHVISESQYSVGSDACTAWGASVNCYQLLTRATGGTRVLTTNGTTVYPQTVVTLTQAVDRTALVDMRDVRSTECTPQSIQFNLNADDEPMLLVVVHADAGGRRNLLLGSRSSANYTRPADGHVAARLRQRLPGDIRRTGQRVAHDSDQRRQLRVQ